MKIRQLKHCNQWVIYDEDTGRTVFQSYESQCAEIKNGTLTLFEDWDYSKTTLRHLYEFLNEEKNSINNYTYSKIFNPLNGLFKAKNKRAFIQSLLDEKVIKRGF